MYIFGGYVDLPILRFKIQFGDVFNIFTLLTVGNYTIKIGALDTQDSLHFFAEL